MVPACLGDVVLLAIFWLCCLDYVVVSDMADRLGM